MMAVRRSIPAIVARLIERGADVHAVMKGTGQKFKSRTDARSLAPAIRAAANCQGFTALDWAETSRRLKAVALLREAGAGGGTTAPEAPTARAAKKRSAKKYRLDLGVATGDVDDFWSVGYCYDIDEIVRETADPDHQEFAYVATS